MWLDYLQKTLSTFSGLSGSGEERFSPQGEGKIPGTVYILAAEMFYPREAGAGRTLAR
jgi:hypothetical protein